MSIEVEAPVVRFDDALRIAVDSVRSAPEIRCPVVIVRDLYGRIHVVLDDRQQTEGAVPAQPLRESLGERLRRAVGAFAPKSRQMIRTASELIDPDAVFNIHDALPVSSSLDREHPILILERTILSDWLSEPLKAPKTPRLTLFGIKGGVGRSTATAVLAQRFAQRGKRVLILDLDLESPGMGSVLLPMDRYPARGIVDWFVEEAVGQQAGLAADMGEKSPLGEIPDSRGGEIIVVPAGGKPRDGYDYLAKLARSYLDTSDERRHFDFAERIEQLVVDLEAHYKPDITLLDSRAGLQDIAAVAVTRLGATSLLFAIDTPQTWAAYKILFERWQKHPTRAKNFRERLKMVAALTPETATSSYLARFAENAYKAFSTTLYEEMGNDETSGLDAWNFNLDDPDAPHMPLVVNWSRSLMQYDPVGDPNALTPQQVEAAFGSFVEGVGSLVFGGGYG